MTTSLFEVRKRTSARELSAKLTEGEIIQCYIDFSFSPSVFCSAKATSLVRGRHVIVFAVDRERRIREELSRPSRAHPLVISFRKRNNGRK